MIPLRNPSNKIWIDQCDAARMIRRKFGLGKALEYLIGQKFLTFMASAESSAQIAIDLPQVIAEIRRVFTSVEIRDYLDRLQRKKYRIRRQLIPDHEKMDFSLDSILAAKENDRFYRIRDLLERRL